MRYSFIILLLLTALISFSCDDDKAGNKIIPIVKDSAQIQKERQDSIYKSMQCDSLPTIHFSKHVIADENDLARIKSEYQYENKNSAENKAIITLNRKEFRFFRIGDTIVIPDKKGLKITDYSIFPPCYPAAAALKKLIVISNKYQCYACYEKGKLVRFAATNTGRERSQTYPGKYYTNWKKKNHRSSLDSNWVLPFTINFHLQAGNAFHQFTMPGRPVSHSCTRQFIDDAEWLYNWVDRAKFDSNRVITQQGTLIIIVDVFDFSRKKFGPWLDLSDNKSANIELPKDPANFEDPFIPIQQIPREARGSLVNKERYIHAEDSLRARGYLRPNITLRESVNYNTIRKQRRAEAEKKKQEEIKKAGEAENNQQ